MAPLRARYFKKLTLEGYDVVISVCNAEAKAITVKGGTHICYMQGPPTQYYWGLYDQYIANPGFGMLNPLARWGLKTLVKPMRRADLAASRQPDIFIANSNYVRGEIERYYGRDSAIIHPPVDVEKMAKLAERVTAKDCVRIRQRLFKGGNFYIVAGRQVSWKRFDLAIGACQKLGRNLLVVGGGPEHANLVRLAGNDKHIKFLPRYNGAEEIAQYFVAARGLIFSNLEPFGIVPVEAMACGLPVIAFDQGGSRDMVIGGENGVFFDGQTTKSVAMAIKEFERIGFDRAKVTKSVERFGEKRFDENFRRVVHEALRKD